MDDPSGLLKNTVEGSHFGAHFSPIYDFLAPFVQMTHSVVVPILAQTVAGPLTAVGLYRISIKQIGHHLALALSIVSLIYPPLVYLMCGDPYETCFAPAVTVWLFLVVIERRWAVAALFVALAFSLKEDQALFICWDALSFFLLAVYQEDPVLRDFSLCAIFGSLVVGLGFILYLRPMIAGTSHWPAFSIAMRAPDRDISVATLIAFRLLYLGQVLMPLAFCPLLAPEALWFALPPLVEVLLAPRPLVWSMGTHYAGAWIGYVLIAWALGICKLSQRHAKLAPKVVFLAFGLSVFSILYLTPAAFSGRIHFRSATEAKIDSIIALKVPRGVSIGVSDVLYGHLWGNRFVQLGVSRSPCYALLYDKTIERGYTRMLQADISSELYGKYLLQWEINGLELYRRTGCQRQ